MPIKLAPSILAADFARLGEQIVEAERAGADRIHIDVMDGHFVPNLSIGVPVVQSIRKVTRLPLECHLMIDHANDYVEAFARAGADAINVHVENDHNLHRTLQHIRKLGQRVGVVLNPATPAAVLEEVLPDVDLVLVMTVNPGFGGQEFLPSTLGKIRKVRDLIQRVKPAIEIEVDGGIDEKSISLAAQAGAGVFVAGSSIYHAPDGVAAAMARLRKAAG